MPINASPEYYRIEKKYLEAKTLDSKIFYLEELIRVAPKHKGSKNLLAELKKRLKRLKEKLELSSKRKKSQKGIRKENFQCILIGLPNSGKSSLLAKLTNAKPLIAPYFFTTKSIEIGTLDYEGVKAQIIDMPAIGSENINQSLINSTDCLLLTICSLNEIDKIQPFIEKSKGEKIIVFTKSDLLNLEQKRKIKETLKSKRFNFVILSSKNGEGISDLKRKIFENMHVIRIYTKEPGKSKTKKPIVLPENSTVEDVAEKIRKGFSKQIKTIRINGPSSKFPNQTVSMKHICKDLDVVEFHTR